MNTLNIDIKKLLFNIVFTSIIFLNLHSHEKTIAQSEQKRTAKPAILLVHLAPSWGGIAQHITKLYKELAADNYDVSILISKKSKMSAEYDQLGLHYFALDQNNKKNFNKALLEMLINICSQKKIDVIHFNWPPKTAYAARKIKALFPVKTIFTNHSHNIPDASILKSFDIVTGVSYECFPEMQKINEQKKLGIKHIIFTPPVFDDNSFLEFNPPTQSRNSFFEEKFSLKLKNLPVVCMVAHLRGYKNHKCLLYAFAKLIYQYKKPTYLMLAGEGSLRDSLEQLSTDLKLNEYVHFLGFTREIPSLLYHSDIKVLSSKDEAFGIVLIEAALMKKPIILSSGATMAGTIIQHEKTGLIFENDNPSDLAAQMNRLLEQPTFAKSLGDNAYNFVKNNFSSVANIAKFKEVYNLAYSE